tara:strand:+ start:822 stop:3050 length:2229 start_codon:yes stop_codon:yes gene_type:complete
MKKKSKYKYILGIQCFASMDSGACILRANTKTKKYDYIAISEERLIIKKYPYTFPLHSIKYCLDHFNLKKLNDIDLLVSDIIREPVWHRSGPAYNVKEFDYIKSKLNISEKKIIQINHHLAHAASVFYTSGFDDSAILIVDGNGTDLETNSFFEGKNKKIKLVDKYKARGIGSVYGMITNHCLNLGTGGEGKTMGLAPFGNKGKPVLDFSQVNLKGIVTDYSNIIKRMPHSDILSFNKNIDIDKFTIHLKKRKKSENIMKGNWKRIAYDLQCEAERCVIHLGKEIEKKVKSKNICIAGGVALNSVANQKLFEATNFKNIFVYPACSDAGIPFGLAVWAFYNCPEIIDNPQKTKQLPNAYTGKTYSSNSIKSLLTKYKINHEKINLSKVAKYLSERKIVGWFQNGSEYGPRALGNRSILADSRDPKMKDFVNNRVKHRENFRPFAPAVLIEDYKKFFKLKNPSPFMLLVAKVIKPNLIPSVTHIDGTARVQTISKKQNLIFYNLIKEFKKITGIGCILNTSFNDAGDPIVETPVDALITFLSTDIDYLILGNYIIKANKINQKIKKQLIKSRKLKIKNNEKKALKLLTTKYNFLERKTYFKKEEKKAYWNSLDKPVYELNEKISRWINKKTKIILFGTFDHTKILIKNFENIKKLNIIGIYPYKKINDDVNNFRKTKLPYAVLKKIKKNYPINTEILISSYEFAYDIEREIVKNFPLLKYYKVYSGYSRNIAFYSLNKKLIRK